MAHSEFSVELLCRLLNISWRGYYACKNRTFASHSQHRRLSLLSQPSSSSDEKIQYSFCEKMRIQSYHQLQAWLCHFAESFETKFYRFRTQRQIGRRYYIYSYWWGLDLYCYYQGFMLKEGCRLCLFRPHWFQPNLCCVRIGCKARTATPYKTARYGIAVSARKIRPMFCTFLKTTDCFSSKHVPIAPNESNPCYATAVFPEKFQKNLFTK